MGRTLLHICCGPCSLYCIDVLKKENRDVTGLFLNMNIHPKDEYLRRMESTRQACAYKNIPLIIIDEYDIDSWLSFDPDKGDRCEMCYTKRINKAAAFAKAEGFDDFTTSLLVSPYQKHDLLRSVCEKASEENDIPFLYRDFREGFRTGQNEAALIGLYRQKYCGCIISKREV